MAQLQTHTEAGEMTQVFIEFVMMQAQNAALFLGQMPHPQGGEPEINLPLAKMFIDQLAVIRARTKGNLNTDEQKVIDSAVSQLQMAFAEVTQTAGHGPSGEFESAPNQSPFAFEPPPIEASPAQPPAAKPAEATEEKSAISSPPPEQEEGRKRFTKSYGA